MLDPIEGNRVSVDFETLSIPGVPIGVSPAKLGDHASFLVDEAYLKIQSDFNVGDKRSSTSRGIIGVDVVKSLHSDMMDEVLSIGDLDDKAAGIGLAAKRLRLN